MLPFANRMGDPEMAYLTEGITESLINDLSRIPTLHVRARGAGLRYDSAKVDPLVAGRELRVDRVVRGSISRTPEKIRIEAELMDVHSACGDVRIQKILIVGGCLRAVLYTEITDQRLRSVIYSYT